MRQPRGFTLLELMIVVVIISLIALLTYPSMSDSLGEARLYRSTRAVVETMTYARIQSIMRNQAHEVTITTSPDSSGGAVVVRRYASTRCSSPQGDPVMTARLTPWTGVTALRNEQQAPLAMSKVCFRPNGRAADAATANPLTGELRIELQRFKPSAGDSGGEEKVGWPLYVKLTNMGVATLAKTVTLPGGGS
ncbi:MAG: prepilin-type N-terminal cleavage/methylation domain-containing protein [Myxococcota bacterium]|nr:prepilin-type N-terminal cleavage/methylation domain-containing protein [Myxococcota bacterium]